MRFNLTTSILAAAGAVSSVVLAAGSASAGSLFDAFSAGQFSFAKDTAVEFSFLESHGKWQSTFGILDVLSNTKTALFGETKGYGSTGSEANDWLNTNDVTAKSGSFNFVAGRQYKLAYWGLNDKNQAYDESMTDVKVAEGSYTFQSSGPFASVPTYKTLTFSPGVILGWEDGWEKLNGRGAGDYNDLILGARIKGGSTSTPEPVSVLGLTGLGLLGAFRRRRSIG